jgi:hypothetical protein
VALPQQVAQLIKRADTAAAYIEAVQLAGFGEKEAGKIFSRPRDVPKVKLKGVPPHEASARFIRQMEKYLRESRK